MFPFIDKSPPHCQVELSVATTYKTGRKEGKSEPKGASSIIAILSAAWAGGRGPRALAAWEEPLLRSCLLSAPCSPLPADDASRGGGGPCQPALLAFRPGF